MIARTSKRTRRSGFTLVEIIVVVIVLGILAAVVIPKYAGSAQDANAASLREQVRHYQNVVDTKGNPTTLQTSWFRANGFPAHLDNDFGIATLQQVNTDGVSHPTNKVLKAGVTGAFWYNAAEGVVRARVVDQGSSAATLAHYNEVNGSNEVALGNYSGGGGGGS